MILSGTSGHALAEGLSRNPDDEDGFRLGHGLGFFQWGLIDQHFLQRGRIGRLLAACRTLGQSMAFGIDENSALLVEEGRAKIVGETGVIVLDCRRARYAESGDEIDGVRISYLDDGDGLDLASGKLKPAPDKKRVRVSRASYRRPAPVRRPAFAGYAIHDLMLRLVEGDPAYYRRDSAQAYHATSHSQITIEIERVPRRARALRAVRNGEIRYSALGFDLRVRRRQLPAGQRPPGTTTVLPPDPVPGARLVLLGNAPMTWRSEDLPSLLAELREPVGIFATASGTPDKVSGEYLDWLHDRGLQAEIIGVSLSNIERASRDRSLLKHIGSMGSLLFTGGDQRRLTETLLHCAEATPVLHAVVSAYERGVPLVGVAAAASAFAGRMIVNGDSRAALRYGASEDAGFSGVVVEQGMGLTDVGLVDQNFLGRHRLGRLLVACAGQHVPYGFGLCEQSGLVIAGGERRLQAIGQKGVIVASLDPAQVRLQPPDFDPAGIRLHFVEPGDHFHLDTASGDAMDHASTGLALLERAIADLAADYNAGLTPDKPRVTDAALRQELTRQPLLQ